jgi:hypothetical protein
MRESTAMKPSGKGSAEHADTLRIAIDDHEKAA